MYEAQRNIRQLHTSLTILYDRCFEDAGVRQRRFRLRPVLDGARTHVIGDGGLWRPGAGPVRPPGHAVIRSGKCSLHGTAVLCCVAGERMRAPVHAFRADRFSNLDAATPTRNKPFPCLVQRRRFGG